MIWDSVGSYSCCGNAYGYFYRNRLCLDHPSKFVTLSLHCFCAYGAHCVCGGVPGALPQAVNFYAYCTR